MFKKFLSLFIAACLLPCPQSYAENLVLPVPGTMVQLSPAFNPPILKGIKVNTNDPFRFDFILDRGSETLSVASKQAQRSFEAKDEQIKNESTKLIKYFLAALTTPEKDMWVNLSPYEKDRIVPESFGQTEMGRDLLAQDYLLKQITASLIYPEGELGQKFWKKIYEVAGNKNIPVNTFNKVWIVPNKAVVYENTKNGTAYIVESNLKVMLEEDYVAKNQNVGVDLRVDPNTTNKSTQDIIRRIVLPELTKEVNEGANFAQLRQVYNSLILATWYKSKIKDSIINTVYSDKNKVFGVNINNSLGKEEIYALYLEAFKKGAYNYIKEDTGLFGISGPKKYFSGGFNMAMSASLDIIRDAAMIEKGATGQIIDVEIKAFNGRNKAMTSELLDKLLHVPVSLQGLEEAISLLRPEEERFQEFMAKDLTQFIAATEQNKSVSLEDFIEKASVFDGKRRNFSQVLRKVFTTQSFEGAAPWIVKLNNEFLPAAGYYIEGKEYDKKMHFGLFTIVRRKIYDVEIQGKYEVLYIRPVKGGMPSIKGGHYMPDEKFVIVRDDSTNYLNSFIKDAINRKVYLLYPNQKALIHEEAKRIVKSDFLGMTPEQRIVTIDFLAGLHELEHLALTLDGTRERYSQDPLWWLYNETFAELKTLANGPVTHFQLLQQMQRIQTPRGEWYYPAQEVLNRLAKKLDIKERVQTDDLPSAAAVFKAIAALPTERIVQAAKFAYESFAFDHSVHITAKRDALINKAIETFKYDYKEAGDRAMGVEEEFEKGGIDLNADRMNLETQNHGEVIRFNMDPAQLELLQNVSGLTPVIINISPVTDLRLFLNY